MELYLFVSYFSYSSESLNLSPFAIISLIMDSYLTALKAYIEAQRENGVSDDMIYQSLISSGWQKETIT